MNNRDAKLKEVNVQYDIQEVQVILSTSSGHTRTTMQTPPALSEKLRNFDNTKA